jgi:hypothetical protein
MLAALCGTQFYARVKRKFEIVDRVVAAVTRFADIIAGVAAICCRC